MEEMAAMPAQEITLMEVMVEMGAPTALTVGMAAMGAVATIRQVVMVVMVVMVVICNPEE